LYGVDAVSRRSFEIGVLSTVRLKRGS